MELKLRWIWQLPKKGILSQLCSYVVNSIKYDNCREKEFCSNFVPMYFSWILTRFFQLKKQIPSLKFVLMQLFPKIHVIGSNVAKANLKLKAAINLHQQQISQICSYGLFSSPLLMTSPTLTKLRLLIYVNCKDFINSNFNM